VQHRIGVQTPGYLDGQPPTNPFGVVDNGLRPVGLPVLMPAPEPELPIGGKNPYPNLYLGGNRP